jgi:hypothetical protein
MRSSASVASGATVALVQGFVRTFIDPATSLAWPTDQSLVAPRRTLLYCVQACGVRPYRSMRPCPIDDAETEFTMDLCPGQHRRRGS